MVDSRLSDKVVLVTGANHGIGAATAKAFAAEGAAVFLHYLRLPRPSGAIRLPDGTEPGTPGEALYRAQHAAKEPVRDV